MRRALKLLLVLTLLAVTFQAGAWYHQRTGVSAREAGPRLLHYACPMHPEHVADHPGDCGACGMALEPVYAEAPGAPTRPGRSLPPEVVAVTARQQQLIGVQVEPVAAAGGSHSLRLTGRVVPDELLVHSLNAGLEGTIREVSAVTTGSRVRKHQVLGTYTAPDFLLAVQSYILALDGLDRLQANRAKDAAARAGASPEANAPEHQEPKLPPIITRGEAGLVVSSGSSNFQQRVDRLHLLGMSELQIDEIRRMRDVPASIKIVAPADGTVLSRTVRPGWKFGRGEEWFRIADLRRVWVLVDVPGADVQHVRPGREVVVTVPGQGSTVKARVSDVAPQVNAETRTLQVRLEAENPGEVLRPDMFVDVELSVAFPTAISVPTEAVLDTGLAKTVYVERAPGEFDPREVETGWRRDGRVEIVRGLQPGDRIVTSGSFLLDSESRRRPAASRAAAIASPSRADHARGAQ